MFNRRASLIALINAICTHYIDPSYIDLDAEFKWNR